MAGFVSVMANLRKDLGVCEFIDKRVILVISIFKFDF